VSQNRNLIIIGVIAAIIIIPTIVVWSSYNELVSAEIQVENEWAQIQVQYQRRYDLIPRVVNATKLYINYEQQLLTDIAKARSGWTNSLSGTVDEQINATGELDSVFNRLLAITVLEDYPELQGNQLVLGLIDELEGTENRIAVARLRYNEAVTEYNKQVRLFPGSIVAGMFGFEKKPYYQAGEGSDVAPNVPI
jgi:LemA protein